MNDLEGKFINLQKPPSFNYLKKEAEKCYEIVDRHCLETGTKNKVSYLSIYKELIVQGQNMFPGIPKQEIHKILHVEAYKIKAHEKSNLFKIKPKFKKHLLLLCDDMIVLASEEK